MAHTHDHDHAHDHDTTASERRMWWVVAISLLTMLAEVGGGMLYGSLALEADGWHMAVHAGVLGIAGAAMIIARREQRTGRFAFGTGKVRALGGFANGLVLMAAGTHVALESLERVFNPEEIHVHGALALAVAGLLANLLCVWLLKGCPECHGHAIVEGHGHKVPQDHNLRAIYLHLLSDAATSLAAIIGVGAAAWGWLRLDPLMALVMALLILWWAVSLLRQVVPLLLDRTTEPVRLDAQSLLEKAGAKIHDLRVWAVAPGSYALLAKLEAQEGQDAGFFRKHLMAIQSLNVVAIEAVAPKDSI